MPNPRWRVLLAVVGAFAALGIALIVSAPSVAGWYLKSRLIPRVAAGLNRRVSAEAVHVDYHCARLDGVIVRSERDVSDKPMVTAESVVANYDWRALLRGKLAVRTIEITGPSARLARHADGSDNFRDLLRTGGAWGDRRRGSRGGWLSVGQIRLVRGRLRVEDRGRGLRVLAGRFDGTVVVGGPAELVFERVSVDSRLVPSTISFDQVDVASQAAGLRTALPRLRLKGGAVQVLPHLALTGIGGTIGPDNEGKRIALVLDGSYGGAGAKLWRAEGLIDPLSWRGHLELAAARFSLARVAEILSTTPVINPRQTEIDGRLVLEHKEGVLAFGGDLAVSGLNLFHPGFARTPLLGLSGAVNLSGRYADRKLVIDHFDIKSRGIEARISGSIDRIGGQPLIEVRLQIPSTPCQTVLDAFPPSLVPHLQGFQLKGSMGVDLHLQVDYEHLDELELNGRVGIDHCQVVEAPEQVSGERLRGSFEHTVEPVPGETLTMIVGPENPDFVPFDQIPPHVVDAFLNTEDISFFRHHGFIWSQFAKALARNLKRGSFRWGASTISMQIVKNVLLSPEKTLGRKLQELFLVWYLEQELSKERLMEIYLNVIEFGPGIYGIGMASHHFFGKPVSEITPLEAAFFSTILPSPRQRYVQYCQGKLSDQWDHYVRRVLGRAHARGLISDEQWEASAGQQIVFARDYDQLSERDCKDRVEAVQEAWKQERRRRLEEAVLSAAPHQLRLYLPDDG